MSHSPKLTFLSRSAIEDSFLTGHSSAAVETANNASADAAGLLLASRVSGTEDCRFTCSWFRSWAADEDGLTLRALPRRGRCELEDAGGTTIDGRTIAVRVLGTAPVAAFGLTSLSRGVCCCRSCCCCWLLLLLWWWWCWLWWCRWWWWWLWWCFRGASIGVSSMMWDNFGTSPKA